MFVFFITIIVVVIIVCSKDGRRRKAASIEENRRKSTPVQWAHNITKEDFERIAIDVAKPIKRLKVFAEDQLVYGEVQTVSGLNTWFFVLDFNDYGKVTGKYWITRCDNYDSDIPFKYAGMLRNAVEEHISNPCGNIFVHDTNYCKYCGAPIVPPGRYCKNCGKRLV